MKPAEIIIHIGMHKTGTTSIQRTLAKHLNDKNFAYIALANPNHSVEIFNLFEENNHPSMQDKSNADLEKQNRETQSKLIENFSKHTKKTCILSGESIRFMSKNALISFKSFLEKYFHTITIVAYIRSPKSYMESALQQVIKDGSNTFDLEQVYPNYRKFDHFFEVFGEENVKLWKFDPRNFPQRNVVLDFCQRLGISMDLENVINDNESLSKEALSLLYIYRKFGPKYGNTPKERAENHHLIRLLSRIDGEKIHFEPQLIDPILKKHKKDIAWIEQILGESLSEVVTSSENTIKSENDLLHVRPASIEKLKCMIGKELFPANNQTIKAKDISTLIHVLRNKKNISLAVNPYEIVAILQKENPELFGAMQERRIHRIVKNIVDVIQKQ